MKTIQLLEMQKEELLQDFENILSRLLTNLITPKNSEENKELYTREETKNLLKVSYTTLYNWNRDGTLKSKTIGKRVYYRKEDVTACLDNE